METSTDTSVSYSPSTTSSISSTSVYTGKVSYTTGISWGPLQPPPVTTTDSGLSEETSNSQPDLNPTDTRGSYISQVTPTLTYGPNSTTWANTTAPPPTETPTCTAFNKLGECLPTTYPPKEPCTNYDSDGICWPDDPKPTDTPTCIIYNDKGEVIDKAGPCTTPDPTCTIFNDAGEVIDKAGPCTTATPTDGSTCIIYNDQGDVIDKAGSCSSTTVPSIPKCTLYDDLGEVADIVDGKCKPDCLLDDDNNCLEPATTTSCDSTLMPWETSTTYIFLPNTTTITVTITSDVPLSLTSVPEFTPPVYCYETPKVPDGAPFPTTSTTGGFGVAPPTSAIPIAAPVPSTVYVTSKNPVTVFTVESNLQYPGGKPTGKVTVTDGPSLGPLTPPPPATVPGVVDTPPEPTGGGRGPDDSEGGNNSGGNGEGGNTGEGTGNGNTGGGNTGGGSTGGGSSGGQNGGQNGGNGGIVGGNPPTTTTIGGVPVIVGPTNVVIGPSTVVYEASPPTTQITIGQQTFTVNPSQVIGPGATIARPVNGGGVFRPTPMPTVINGIPIQLGPSNAVIQGTTFAIGQGAPQTTIVVNGQTISIGSGGLGFADTTVAPPSQATNIVILGGDIISALGASQAVIGGSTLNYGDGSPLVTKVFNGETITVGPMGIAYGTTTLGGASNPSKLQLGIAGGIAITQIGSALAVIDGTTYTIGPNATPITKVINGKEVTIGPSGIVVGGATLTYPFNQDLPTQVITAGGITFSRLGSTLVDIGGTTYTIGPGGKPTTRTYNGKTVSVGPGGIGFKTTTLTASSPFPSETGAAGAKETGTKNSAAGSRCFYGFLGICMVLSIGYNV